MRKFSRYFIPFSVSALIVVFLFLAMKPKGLSRENSIEINAVVTRVNTGGLKDIVISLADKRGMYVISNTATHELTAQKLHQKLINKVISVSYEKPGFFSHFNPMTDIKYITELKLGDKIIYSQLQP